MKSRHLRTGPSPDTITKPINGQGTQQMTDDTKNKGIKKVRNKPPISPGRPKGVPNKTTGILREALLIAATNAGDNIKVNGKKTNSGMVGYLTQQAEKNPRSFMTMLSKVLPMQLTGADDGPIKAETSIIFVPVGPDHVPGKD